MCSVLLIFLAFSTLALLAVAAMEHLFQNSEFGLCLSSKEGSAIDVQLAPCSSTDNNQRVTIELIEHDDAYRFTVYLKINDKCLSNYQHAMDDGIKVILWDCYGQQNQRWKTYFQGNLTFFLKLQEQQKCLSASGTNGEPIVQTTCDYYAPQQIWKVEIAEEILRLPT